MCFGVSVSSTGYEVFIQPIYISIEDSSRIPGRPVSLGYDEDTHITEPAFTENQERLAIFEVNIQA